MNEKTSEIAKHILQIIITRAAASMNYTNWSADYVASQIREIPEMIKKTNWFVPINPADLTEAEMRELGFGKWSEEDPMFLIPLWLFPFLPAEVDCGSISGEKRILKKIRNG